LTHHNELYFAYLKQRSNLGALYRRYRLYPKLNQYLHGRTLDVGCGLGDMLHFRDNTVGVDINPLNVQYCTSMGLDAYLMEVDVLPFPNASFDSVLLDNVLEHIAKPDPLLKEIRRVLKPGGNLVIGVPGILGMQSDLDHKVFYSEETLQSLANKTSFRVEHTFYAPLRRSHFLSQVLRQYCIYTSWIPKADQERV
jgi:SAM-dependent methyltransferase